MESSELDNEPVVRLSDVPSQASWYWGVILWIWFGMLCFVPDPRPLGAPAWAVGIIESWVGLSEPGARAVATVILRAFGIGVLGVLCALALTRFRLLVAAPIVLIGSVALAIISLWVNYGYFPIAMQIQLAVISAVIGGLAGLVLRRSLVSLVVLVLFAGGIFVWGTSTGISDDLDALTRATGQHILDQAEDIPDGDEGFIRLLQMAFEFAEDNAHRRDAVEPNKAAILALGVILGEEKVAAVAGRSFDIRLRPEIKQLYQRISVRGRNDLTRHFWVSAALAVLSDQSLSMDIGITKELMDATPGGSGFSFVDLTADRAGTLFAGAATQHSDSARQLQVAIRRGVELDDLFPEIDSLPEGITSDEFQNQYGGLGGEKTSQIVDEIRQRLQGCRLLHPEE